MKDNWRNMPAGAALDRRVAERLGYRVERAMYAPYPSPVWVLTRPGDHGEKEFISDFGWTLDEAWSWAFDPEIEIDGEIVSLVPLYSRDASVPLPLAEGEEIEIHELWSGTFAARCNQPLSSRLAETQGELMTADTLALARLRAWLAHDDAKRGDENEVKTDV